MKFNSSIKSITNIYYKMSNFGKILIKYNIIIKEYKTTPKLTKTLKTSKNAYFDYSQYKYLC